jgi:hypothetical protein
LESQISQQTIIGYCGTSPIHKEIPIEKNEKQSF